MPSLSLTLGAQYSCLTGTLKLIRAHLAAIPLAASGVALPLVSFPRARFQATSRTAILLHAGRVHRRLRNGICEELRCAPSPPDFPGREMLAVDRASWFKDGLQAVPAIRGFMLRLTRFPSLYGHCYASLVRCMTRIWVSAHRCIADE
jgi:hypothetical protein